VISSKSQVISEAQETQVVHNQHPTSTETVTKSKPDKKPTQKSSNKHSMESSSMPKQCHFVHKPVITARQPSTKPVAMLGMERRTQLMAQRRQAREDRKRQREEELLVSCYRCEF